MTWKYGLIDYCYYIISIQYSVHLPLSNLSRVISRITLGIILKRPIEPSPLIRGQGSTLLQPLYQIRVTGEQTTEEEGIVAAGLQHAPGVFVVPATG